MAWGNAPQTYLSRRLRRDQTPAEQALWELLRGRRLAGLKFRRQQPLGPFVADFYCREQQLVVEADGPIHEQRRERDAERDAWLAAQGMWVLHFTNEVIFEHPRRVCVAIVRAAKEHAASLARNLSRVTPPLSGTERGRG